MVGSTFEAVTVRDVRELITLQPPLKEQLGIVEHLNKVNNDINSIVLDIQNQISKLKEYRESLIYEAVTGKIDLRNYEPKEIGRASCRERVEIREVDRSLTEKEGR